MSFHLSETPTLEAVANQDEKLLEQDLQAKVEAALKQTDEVAEVAEAVEAHQAAADRLTLMRTAERALNEQVTEMREKANRVAEAAIEAMVNRAAEGEKLETRKFTEVAGLENQLRLTARAIERLSEHLIPLAHISSLREESQSLMARVRALQAIAHERAEKVLGQIREAVSEEMVLPVDLSKGVAGALLARAGELKRRAVQLAETADRLERDYQNRRKAV